MLRRLLPIVMLAVSCSAFQMPLSTVTPKRYKWFEEAEKKHGRVALLAVPTLYAIQSATGGDPIPWLNAQPYAVQTLFYTVAACAETLNLKRLDKGFTLKDDEIPGKLIASVQPSPVLNTIENGAGRVAMLVATMMLLASVA